MKQLLPITLAGCLTAGLLFGMPAQSQPQSAAGIDTRSAEQLQREIRQLRLDLVLQGIEWQNWKLQQLEHEAARVQEENERLTMADHSLRAELQQMNAHLASAAAESKAETEALRADLVENRLPDHIQRLQPLRQRADELARTLTTERARLAKLQQEAARRKQELGGISK